MASNGVFTNTSEAIPTQMFLCFVYTSLTISVFLLRQKLDKRTQSQEQIPEPRMVPYLESKNIWGGQGS